MLTLEQTVNTDESIVGLSDSYKFSHWKQYPRGTTRVLSFFESRGGKFPTTTFFGLQHILKKYLEGCVVTQEAVDEMKELAALHFGQEVFHVDGWQYILDRYNGRLPLEIKAVPEGTTVPYSNVLMTVENTDDRVPWLTNYVETLLVQAWYPSTVATQSREMKRIILRYLEETGTPELIDFKLHDFGFRGSTSVESSAIGGAAHLVNFKGTDTFSAIKLLRRYYNEPMAGFSVPAAEHSTITSWGRDNEREAYCNMLTSYPTGIVAVVSDSYNIFDACQNLWGGELRQQVLERDGVLVVRPDSGDPKTVIVKVLDILGECFGYETNSKGYKVLNPQIRVIQGDGICYESLAEILEAMKGAGWSADNITFGSGGGLIQKVDRDTLKFAFKCSAVKVNGVWRDVMKDPVTDPGKRSKAGRLKLVKRDGVYQTIRDDGTGDNELIPVFRNGEVLENWNFAEIRERAAL